MTLDQLDRRLQRVADAHEMEHSKLDQQRGRYNELKTQLYDQSEEVERLREECDLIERTRNFLASVLRRSETDIEELFSSIGTAAIQSVFGEERKLQFKFLPKDNSVSVSITTLKPSPDGDGWVEISPAYEGGGPKDIISIAMRVAMMELYTPRQNGPLLFDEPIKNVADDESVQGVGEFLRKLSAEMNRQIIVVTHKARLAAFADRSFTFSRGQGDTAHVRMHDNNGEEEES